MADRPWMTALEMQFRALKSTAMYDVADERNGWVAAAAYHLRRAECFSFSRETIVAIAAASRTVPGSSNLHAVHFPAASGWWWFAAPMTVPNFARHTDQCVALSWSTSELHGDDPYVGLYGWALSPDAMPFPAFHERLIGTDTLDDLQQTIRADPPQNEEHRLLRLASLKFWRFLLAGTVWLEQRIVSMSLGHVERHRRKQLAREHQAPIPSDVKIIELRRLESQPHAASPNAEPVDWSCRWIVNGHWRNQMYANNEHKLIYIQPFVKGPADKPLRVPTHTVYQVDR